MTFPGLRRSFVGRTTSGSGSASLSLYVAPARGGCQAVRRNERAMRMRDLNALAIFAKVVEAKSFSAAARALKMPISTVSRRIAELEEQLGVRLLERSARRPRPPE